MANRFKYGDDSGKEYDEIYFFYGVFRGDGYISKKSNGKKRNEPGYFLYAEEGCNAPWQENGFHTDEEKEWFPEYETREFLPVENKNDNAYEKEEYAEYLRKTEVRI